jgi:hypothetical protein
VTAVLDPPLAPSWRGLDLTRLAKAERGGFLQSYADRAEARTVPFYPISPEERLTAFKRLNFYPNGLYVPDDEEAKFKLLAEVKEVGNITTPDARLRAYHELQLRCERWQTEGMVGRWTGQQALARSRARFRIAAFGRRAGKTTEAAMEAIAVAYVRPRSWVWLAAPTIKLADRAFQKVLETIRDLGLDTRSVRDSAQDKVIILENGAKIEAISLENIWSAAGAAIDFAVIDEAAQIVPEAWTRAILPPLTDRNGQALLISSWEGEGDFFQQKALEAEADHLAHGTSAAWEMFKDASYDVNFYAFPQGEQTPALVQAAKEMDPLDYLEQFGAIPATSRDRVFPEFKERVHVGDGPGFEYNPGLPVVLTVDPSGGANPYAILAIQDYSDHIVIFDEIYESHRSTEELAPMLTDRDWLLCREVSPDGEATQRWEIDNCKDMIVDSAVPEEVRRWIKMGFPAYGVPEKPQVPDRLPLMKNWLRDPVRFKFFYDKRQREVLEQMGMDPDTDVRMLSLEDRRAIIIRVEETLSDNDMSRETQRWLRSCSRVRVNRRNCPNFITEAKTYQFPKKRRLNMNYREVPRDWMNHCMDAWGYYLWDKKRFAFEQEVTGYDYLNIEVEPDEERDTNERRVGRNATLAAPSPAEFLQDRASMWLAEMRSATERNLGAGRSYLGISR